MKTALKRIFRFSIILACLVCPAAAGMVGNASTGINPGQVTSTVITTYTTTLPTTAAATGISLPVVPQFVLLIVGILIIIAALSGLVWRYLHPKYVPKDQKE